MVSPRAVAQATAGQAVGKISITNISHQKIAPILVVVHRKSASPVYTVGMPASAELASLAEAGSPAALEALVKTDPSVLFATHLVGTGANNKIEPGETVSGDIIFNPAHLAVTIVGMLVSTNDGFMGYSGAEIPYRAAKMHYTAYAWDAGSEANTETCMDVPGPPCSAESGNARHTEGAEGMVLVHPGIHGMADVTRKYDWRGPVATFTISGLGVTY